MRDWHSKRFSNILELLLCLLIILIILTISVNVVKKFHKTKEELQEKVGSEYIDKMEKLIEYEIEKRIEYIPVSKLSEHNISNLSSSTERNVNLERACEIISEDNGKILEPGEEFNWFEDVGPCDESQGFKLGGAIVNGEHVMVYGGGVCQVASTLNSAAIKAGLQTQASKHSQTPAYFGPEDYEASVSYGSKNFRFTNTFDFPIIIKMWTEGQTVYSEIYKADKKETWIFHEKSDTSEGS